MNTLVHSACSRQAQSRPEATAVVCDGHEMTYGSLERFSNRLAQLLVASGCRRGDRIGLFMPKLPEAIAGMLGVLKAGAAYVPLDPTDPATRLARTLESADCRWILVAGPVAPRLREALACANLRQRPLIGWLQEGGEQPEGLMLHFYAGDLDGFADSPPNVAIDGDDLAHILFTSGSTGTPKGVMITHANVTHAVDWAIRYFGITRSDRIAQHVPLRFDLSTMDIFTALFSGATLCLIPRELNVLPGRLAAFMRESALTQCLVVPSLLNWMAKHDTVRFNDFPSLRRMLFCGEVLPTPALIYWMERLPHVQFTNLYGPTETTICSSYFTVKQCPRDEREPIPIGAPCEGEKLLILDERRQPVADGEIGDLYIAGPGLSPGYWRDADKTKSAFLHWSNGAHAPGRIYRTGDLARRDADGLYHFVGRNDMQIKCRGYRIELGDIEAALHTIPELRESAIVAITTEGFESAQICCAYVAHAGMQFSPADLRRRLTDLLPLYMLPVRWKAYDVLPKNVNGKIDRARLRGEFQQPALQPGQQQVQQPSQDPGHQPAPQNGGGRQAAGLNGTAAHATSAVPVPQESHDRDRPRVREGASAGHE